MSGLGIVTLALLLPLVTDEDLSIRTDGLRAEATFLTAYAMESVGTLSGADIFDLARIKEPGAQIASMERAGTFDVCS